MAFEIAKAGWMHRVSSVLRRWKRNWFVLYKDGMLKFFENPESHMAEEVFNLKRDLVKLEDGSAITDSDPPEGRNRKCLLALHLKGDKRLIVCAESPDDLSAWRMGFEEARMIGARARAQTPVVQTDYTHFGTHPPAYVVGRPACSCYRSVVVPDGAQVNHVVQNPDGSQTNVVYVRERSSCCHCHGGLGMGTGLLAGAAVGSLMWGPLLWW